LTRSVRKSLQSAARRAEFLAGARDTFPLLVGAFPFGIIFGALGVTSGLTPWAAAAMSAFVFAGSAQFITTQLVHEAAPGLVIVLTIAQNPIKVDPKAGVADVLSMPFNGYDLITRIANVHKVASAATEKGPSRLVVVFAPKGGGG